jgi:hypothetical protein
MTLKEAAELAREVALRAVQRRLELAEREAREQAYLSATESH